MFNKPLKNVTEDDLHKLKGIPESDTIEYKSSALISKDEFKGRLLETICGFANGKGGYLFIGIKEKGGKPTDIKGINKFSESDKEELNHDSAIRRIEQLIISNIEPALTDYIIEVVELKNKNWVIIIHIPKSFQFPHWIVKNKKFYIRKVAQNLEMRYQEIKEAFLLKQSIQKNICDFRSERIEKILKGETPVKIETNLPSIAIHFIPVSAIETNNQITLRDVFYDIPSLFALTLSRCGEEKKYVTDGVVTFDIHSTDENRKSFFYVKMYKDGCLECFSVLLSGKSIVLPQKKIENALLEFYIKHYLDKLKIYKIPYPFYIFLSYLNIKSLKIEIDPGVVISEIKEEELEPIADEHLILPEIFIENENTNLSNAMKPIFDIVWNSAGLPRSLSYDNDGNWHHHKNR